MELTKPVSSENSQQERPTTRWRREEINPSITQMPLFDDPEFKSKPPSDDSFVSGKHRPISRRGIMSRQSAMSGSSEENANTQHFPSAKRPMTASHSSGPGTRPPSASSYHQRSTMPGTASRLSLVIQPSTHSGTATSISGMSAVERPITQQGLSGLRPGSRGPPMRNVQDKRYFEGILQMKVRDLTEEVERLNKENDSHHREQSTFLVYDGRVKEMAAELTDLQGLLADFNLVVDKCNTDTDKGDIDAECQELKSHCNLESSQLEQLFSQHKDKEAQIQQLETEIEDEKHMTDNLLAAMNLALMEHYTHIKQNNNQLQQHLEQLQQQLDLLTSKKMVMEDQIAVSHIKREAVHLYFQLHEIEQRRETLVEEEKTRATPAQEREQLLQRVKDDNAEMTTMDRQMTDLKEEIRKRREELEQIEQDLDESQSERHQKFRELRRREETMEQFLSTFQKSFDEEMTRILQLEEDIVTSLQQMSHNIGLSRHLPSVEDYSAMKESLAYKEGELEKSKKTVDSLSKEQSMLQVNLQKVEELEEKIKVEMETLRQRMVVMSEEMVILSDLDTLSEHIKNKRVSLELDQEILAAKQQPIKELVITAKEHHDQLKKQLDDNETYAQLKNLERKLSLLEQNNFAIQEFIAVKKTETAYEPMKGKVLEMKIKLNNDLKKL